MNLIGRQDRLLLVGLATALMIVFTPQIRYLLDLAREVEQNFGLALTPALLILIVVFLFHQQGKRQDEKTRAATAEADAFQAESRAIEMERLVTFGQALGRSLDVEAIREVVVRNLPRLADSDEAWVMTRFGGHWEALTGTGRQSRHEIELTRQHIADRALSGEIETGAVDAVIAFGCLCLPMTAGGQTVGVLAVPESTRGFTEGRRRVLTAAATLLGISLRNAELFREVRENSLRDGLTGCFNRAHSLEVIDSELRRARRSHAPVSLIMFDLDHFKGINDKYGHLCGDAVLTAVSARMGEVLRGSDLKCRYGGEQFLILLPETALEGAKRVADTLRREFAELRITWKDQTIGLTASFGVSTAAPSEVDVQSLIARADAALYRAKDQGRNCVRLGAETVVA